MEFSTALIIDLVLLVILLLSAVWMFVSVTGYTGVLRKPFRIIGTGIVLMGLAHLLEVTTSFIQGHHETYLIAFIHHFLATLGFLVIAIGFRKLTHPK